MVLDKKYRYIQNCFIHSGRVHVSRLLHSLTTVLCNWSTFTGAQIFANFLCRLFLYMPVTPITTGISATFFNPHFLFRMFWKSVYFIVLHCELNYCNYVSLNTFTNQYLIKIFHIKSYNIMV